MTKAPRIDPFARFRASTNARIGLGRAGDGLPTNSLLEFQLAHARARDAVHGAVDFTKLAAGLAPMPTLHVVSAAENRARYIRRPDLGRQLCRADERMLAENAGQPGPDVLFVIADGLSASSVMTHAAPLIRTASERLQGLSIGPIVLAEQARVAIGDPIGHILNAAVVVVLIGERPGLSVADSLGVYITYGPHPGRTDAERNCISNIHGKGLSYAVAANKLAWLVQEARRLKLSGVSLKDTAPALSEEGKQLAGSV